MSQVTVIMNIRNGASTLGEAMDSVVAQTFTDWELIVWDDRSTDDSAKIVARYSDPRIRYFLSPEETSLGKARDNAMRQARGEWLAFLDQDDLWMPRKLEMQMALADPGAGIIYGRTVRFYPSGMQRDYDQTHEFRRLPEGDIFTQLFTKSCFIAMSSAVFRRTAIEEIGGVPDRVAIVPDYYLYIAVARRYPARAVQHVVCRYRMHAANMSRLSAIAMHQEVLWLMDQWADSLDPHILAMCRKRHSTAIALEEMRSPTTAVPGALRLLTEGSLASQLKRPFMFAFHIVRRNVLSPHWKASAPDVATVSKAARHAKKADPADPSRAKARS
jgi:hypothetical protein